MAVISSLFHQTEVCNYKDKNADGIIDPLLLQGWGIKRGGGEIIVSHKSLW